MAKRRYINTAFWDDFYISQLDPSEKLLFLYLLTAPNTNNLGVYQIPLKKIALDTGFDLEMVKKLMQRFAEDGKAYYELGWVVLKNWLKNQNTKSPKIQVALRNEFGELPAWLQKRLTDTKDEISIPYRYGIDTKSHSDLDGDIDSDLDGDFNKTTSSEVGPAAIEARQVEFGDHQVNQVVEHFETRVGKMPRPVYQRRAAKTLMQRHGFEKVIGAINLVAASRGEPFCPVIASLCALRDKWVELETFAMRTSKQMQPKGVRIS